VNPSKLFLTPLLDSTADLISEKSAVNPFSIANRNSETQNEVQMTAEGFFKNPTLSIKKG
jgi:hypothetical protein